MEAAARKAEYGYAAPVTRVYAYSRSAVAEVLPMEEPQPVRGTRVEKQTQSLGKHKRRVGRRILALVAVAALAASLLVVMVRYAQIAESYSAVSKLKSDIKASQQELAALQVELNTAVSLDRARETAEAAGMDYPTAEQIIRVEGDTAASTGE